MKKELPPPRKTAQEKSFRVAIEQMAKLLRTEVKLKDRATKVLKEETTPSSFNHKIAQIAKLLRTQVKTLSSKKRTWKKAEN